jgi:hypothetical protein
MNLYVDGFFEMTVQQKLFYTCILETVLISMTCIGNAPWYVQNSDLHRDLGIKTVADIVAKFSKSHEKRLQDHVNIEASRLLNVNNITRRLKRKKPFELVIR